MQRVMFVEWFAWFSSPQTLRKIVTFAIVAVLAACAAHYVWFDANNLATWIETGKSRREMNAERIEYYAQQTNHPAYIPQNQHRFSTYAVGTIANGAKDLGLEPGFVLLLFMVGGASVWYSMRTR